MKRRWLIALGSALGLGLVVILVSLAAPPGPVARVRVVDEAGRPVSGATITPDGLRPKNGGGHYWWTAAYPRSGVEPVAVRTDANGYAGVLYPYYVDEKLETGEISFAVDHPDFCADRPFRVVAASPPANAPLTDKLKDIGMRLIRRVQSRPDPVVLKRGGIVRVTGYVGTNANVRSNVQAEISHQWPAGSNFWQRSGPVLWSRRVAAGRGFLRAVECGENGRVWFSDDMAFGAKSGETNEFELELKPGARLSGRLDDSVPRPVKSGRVCMEVFMEGQDGNSTAPIWMGWRPVSAEGTFLFESLPKGRMEIIGICDGFVSSNGPPPRGVGTSQRLPQWFTLNGQDQDITLVMERAAACEFTIVDASGRPLSGAQAGFWPNVLFGGNGSSVFADNVYNTEDYFRGRKPVDWDARRKRIPRDFHAVSDEHGVALVLSLPPGNQEYSVSHTNYDMPIRRTFPRGPASRSASLNLSAGETGKVTVRMEAKGKDALTH